MKTHSSRPLGETGFFSSYLLFAVTCLFVGVVIGNAVLASSDEKSTTSLDNIYYSLAKIQTPSGVLASDEDRYCQTAAQAMASVVLIGRGHPNRARRILDFFEDIRISESEKEGGFKGFADFYEIKTHRPLSDDSVGISTDASTASEISSGVDVSHFANAFVALAALNYRLATGDKRFDKLINSLGGVYLGKINRWGLYSDDDGSSLSSNVAASAAFLSAAMTCKISRTEGDLFTKIRSLLTKDKGRDMKPTPTEEEYLKALKRLRFALMDLMYDSQKKFFKSDWSDESGPVQESEQVFASLILGGKGKFYYNFATSLDNRQPEEFVEKEGALKSALTVWLSSGVAKKLLEDYLSGLVASEGEKTGIYLLKTRAVGGKFFTHTSKVATYYDLLATAFYVFAITGGDPFDILWSATEPPDGIISREFSDVEVIRGEKWKADTFEAGEEKFYIVESQSLKNAGIPLPPSGIFADSKIKSEGSFSLKIRFITKQSKDEKCQGVVSRVFYPPQDFTSISSIKCWVNARPATFTLGVTNLKIRLRLTDQSGASADSRNLSYSGRGVENNLVFPSGFTPVSPSRVPDYAKIKKISFVLEEDTQTTWDINLDNIRVE